MKTTKKVWIAGGLIAALALGGLVAATGESPLVTLGNGCCRVTLAPSDEPLSTPIPPVVPWAEPANAAP